MPTNNTAFKSALRRLVAMDIVPHDLHLFLGATDRQQGIKYQRLQISGDLELGFKERILQPLLAALSDKLSDIELHPFDFNVGSRSNEVQFLAAADFPEIERQLRPLDAPEDLPVFAVESSFLRKMKHYIAEIDLGAEGKLRFFKVYTKGTALDHTPLSAVLSRRGQFDVFNDKLLHFTGGVDGVVWEEKVYIFNDRGFMKVFDLFHTIRADAEAVLTEIQSHLPITNFDDFRTLCLRDTRKCAKLKSIYDRNYLARLTVPKLQTTIANHRLNVEVRDEQGVPHLVYDASDQWSLIKLLHDDFVSSTATDNHYEALNKRLSN